MPRKKPALNLSDNSTLLNELLRLIKNHTTTPQKEKKRPSREPRVGFNLLIPYKLYVQLKNYVELYADKKESMTEIILVGLEKELKERYTKKAIREKANSEDEIS